MNTQEEEAYEKTGLFKNYRTLIADHFIRNNGDKLYDKPAYNRKWFPNGC